jgi:hypothetical protein
MFYIDEVHPFYMKSWDPHHGNDASDSKLAMHERRRSLGYLEQANARGPLALLRSAQGSDMRKYRGPQGTRLLLVPQQATGIEYANDQGVDHVN